MSGAAPDRRGVEAAEVTMAAKRVTLKLLAQDLGVSRATVSNAYNRPDQLSEALRARILQRADELGFAGPDPVARGLRRGRVGAVGVLVDASVSIAFSDPVAVLVLDGLAHELQEDGVGLLLHAASSRPEAEALVRAAAVDGWVLIGIPQEHPTIAAAQALGRAMVVIDQPMLPGVPTVTIDDAGGARAAAAHMLDLGHRRFGLLTPPLHGEGTLQLREFERRNVRNTVMASRLTAAMQALTAAGLRSAAVTVVECSANDAAAGAVGTALLLETPEPPTAVLALSDQLALGALRAAREHRVAVPAELSVIGFDDIPAGRTSHPPLTTVAQPLRERGVLAGQLMRALLRDEAPEAPEPFRTSLVVRRSTAPSREPGATWEPSS